MPSLVGSSGRIEKLEILNFKSYKCHQIVGSYQNFAAIIADHGVGRTDLEDAISFVLGVRSFQLPGVQPGNSFYGFQDRDLGEQRGRVAYVKLVFRTGSGEEIQFGRAITSSGTSEYRINNIPVTWDIYNNTMKGLNILGEVETDACKDYKEQNPVSEALSAPDELKKIHLELEIQKARSEEKMIPTHQKRKMFAAQRKLAREQKDEEDEEDVHRIRTELELKAAEARMKVEFKGNMESLSADIERTASDFEALDQYETLRERERKSLERSDAARKAAIEAADKWKAANQLSSRPASPMSMLDNGDAASNRVNVTQVPDITRSKSRLNMKDATESRENGRDFQSNGIASIDMGNITVHELNRVGVESVEKQSNIRDGDADIPIVELSEHRRINRYRLRNGSIDGTQSPGYEEWKQVHESHRRAERSSWPGASAPHVLRTLDDYDDQVYWSDSAEDVMDPDRDNVGKAEELAEELYRDAMELHNRLVAEADVNAAIAASVASGKGHSLIAETKETCGDIMLYANSHGQNGRNGTLAPVLIPADNSESRSVSFSQTSQCSADTPGSQGQTEGAHLDKIDASVLNFRSEANQNPGSTQLVGKGGDIITNGDHHLKMKTLADFPDNQKDGDYKMALEKEMNRLRDSNVRKQVKIDSLQKWRAYYKLELEDKDRILEQIEKNHVKEMTKKDKAVKKMEKQHARDLAHQDIKREELEDKLRGEIKELNLVIEELSGQLYDMEEHLAAGGIPYKPTVNENTGPSSKTLLSAVIGVKEAAHTFSRTFMSYLKQHLTKARDLDEQICLESEVIVARPSDYKFLVQSFICRRMFLDFDSECFNIDTCMTEIFDIEEHSRACFQEYMTYRNVADTVTLLTDNRPHSAFLREFCFKKFLHIVSESTEEAFFGDFNHSDDICAGRHPSSRFYESYCKLAVSVWLLHRLAFSFQPPARMISVRKGAQFNPTYMESAVPGISSGGLGDGESALPFEALVGLMVHPGFRVGSSVIRAQVYLVTT
ncbi:hypothetical protein KC19_6G005800 [Ceratodon purpureus]|uniref:GIL1/IRKI C-terminal domain-containing protein n=1 Tax=Ceratodon purpureus TaxID=3225 RepID=A0A8T0H8H9_CERPU|nr:hypothetical protein KC19_6G005800 [Ceratodon purpureus]